MKDRQSKLAKDLDRFVAHRRLLLTGTPLQNELRELWSLLNLLLPEVFDDKKGFTEWFGDVLGGGGAGGADEWLEKEKRVVVIHRLHQILEPFMLRRQVGLGEGAVLLWVLWSTYIGTCRCCHANTCMECMIHTHIEYMHIGIIHIVMHIVTHTLPISISFAHTAAHHRSRTSRASSPPNARWWSRQP